MWTPGNRNFRQIVLLQAKRTLDNINKQLHVINEVIGKIVGQAIALQWSGQMAMDTTVCPDRYIALFPLPNVVYLLILYLGPQSSCTIKQLALGFIN